VLFATACVGLGRWQLHRYQDKHARSQLVARNYDAAPVPLSRLLPTPDTPFDRREQWRQVEATGRYDAGHTVLVRNRPHSAGSSDPTYGYEVLVPLRLADGSALLVDRGWIPNGTRGSNPGQRPDVVPDPPSGPVRVVVRLRAGEPARDRQLPAGQVASIFVPRVATLTGLRLRPAYGGLLSEDPAPATALAPLDPPQADGNEGINASYAVQWVVFALLGLGFPVWLRRRRREAAAQDAAAGEAGEAGEAGGIAEGAVGAVGAVAVAGADGTQNPRGAAGARPASGSSGTRATRPARPRRRRIWDADDEDDDAVPD
jgi:cytochrome oxidase assembly protein ShyY1